MQSGFVSPTCAFHRPAFHAAYHGGPGITPAHPQVNAIGCSKSDLWGGLEGGGVDKSYYKQEEEGRKLFFAMCCWLLKGCAMIVHSILVKEYFNGKNVNGTTLLLTPPPRYCMRSSYFWGGKFKKTGSRLFWEGEAGEPSGFCPKNRYFGVRFGSPNLRFLGGFGLG